MQCKHARAYKAGKLKKVIGEWTSEEIESYILNHSGVYVPHNSINRGDLETKALRIKIKV